jgi:inhibitor of KinA
MSNYNLYPLGDSAVVIQLGQEISKVTSNHIRAICAWLDEYTFEGFIEYVPAYTTITIYYLPQVLRYPELTDMLREMMDNISENETDFQPDIIEVPVLYGGEWGPDLDFVAAHNHISAAEVIALHSAEEYLVYMIGFAPGFPYLGGMNEKIAAPRRESPRSKIPAGSVGIAGKQTGVYPITTPGGWQIIGRAAIDLFDIKREVPALLKVGDLVRFRPVSEIEFMQIRGGEHGD